MVRTSSPGRPRRLLGLRITPGRLALAVFRLPVPLYDRGGGWILGRVFLRLVHVGRRSGQRYSTIAMVITYDPEARRAVICSGWGPAADWVRNLRAGPAARVDIGHDHFVPIHRFLTDQEAFEAARQFRRQHPRRMRFISRVLGWGDLRSDGALRTFVAERPFVAFEPAPSP